MDTLFYLVLGALFAAYFGLAGIDYGVGLLLPGIRDEADRRRALNAIGPMFLGNEVWIVGAAGVLIAAFPRLESTLFTAAYPILVPTLLGLVAVNAAVQLRSRGVRRRGFDALIAVSSAVLAVGWGMLLGALLTGRPIAADGRIAGNLGLLHPYTVLCGLTTAVLFLANGAWYLAWRLPDGPVRTRAGRVAALAAPAAAVAVLLVILFAYVGTGVSAHHGAGAGVGVVIAGLSVGALVAGRGGRPRLAFACAALAAALPVVAVGAALFPDILVSTVDGGAGVTVHSGAAGAETLRLLAFAALPLLPVLVAVQAACWWLFRRRPDRPQPAYW